MPLSRRTTRFVAIMAGAFVLLCQTAAAVQACTLGAATASGSALTWPCHETTPQSGDTTGHDVHQANCPAQYASVSLAKLDIPAAADMPGLAAHVSQPAPLTHENPIVAKLPTRAESPPLTILHCRLRN